MVATSRWISWPGRWKARAAEVSGFRSLQANISAASEALATPTVARASGPGRSSVRSRRSWPAAERTSIGTTRFEPHRSCSLVAVAGSSDPASYAPIALCSTPW